MSKRILIVEDESIVAEDIKVTLESFGYTVVGIADRQSAALEAMSLKPDLVLLDILLKGKDDGIQTAKLIREIYNVPVVYLSAHADRATIEAAKLTEPAGYVLKPFEERELYSAIELAIYRHRAEDQNADRWLKWSVESIRYGIIAADSMGSVKFLNPSAERMLGWTFDEAVGRDLETIYRVIDTAAGEPSKMPGIHQLLSGSGEHDRPQRCMVERKDGVRTLVEHSLAAVNLESSVVVGTVVIFRDLSPLESEPA